MTIIITKVEKNLGKVTILIIYSLVAFFFLTNGEGLFSAWETNWTLNAIIYILGVTLFLSVLDDYPKELRSSFIDNLKYFSASSIITILLLLIIRDFGLMFQHTSPMPYHLVLPNLAFQLIIVSISEELIFRGAIFGYLYDRFKLRPERQTNEVKVYGWIIPYFGSASLFAVFHYAVYGLDISSMALVFVMGLLLAYAVDRWGIGASIGVHWIWNCMAIGIFCLPSFLESTGLV